jgi:hypothetical protein
MDGTAVNVHQHWYASEFKVLSYFVARFVLFSPRMPLL